MLAQLPALLAAQAQSNTHTRTRARTETLPTDKQSSEAHRGGPSTHMIASEEHYSLLRQL